MIDEARVVRPGTHLAASAWSLVGFGLTVVGGLAVNVVIENGYGRPALGLFSACLSVVIIGGQLGTLGQHNATLYFVSAAESLGRDPLEALGSSLRTTLRASVCLTAVASLLMLIVPFGDNGPAYRTGLLVSLGGLLLFPLNKVLVAYMNGMHRFRQTSLAGAMRFVLLALWSVILIRNVDNWHMAPLSITAAEASLAVLLLAGNLSAVKQALRWHGQLRSGGSKDVRAFGLRSLPAALFLDINTRVDVLVLSILKGSDVVGQYTMASALSEGLYQLCMSTRIAVEPRVAALFSSGDTRDLRNLLLKHAVIIYAIAIPVIAVSILVYGPVATVMYGAEDLAGSQPVFVVLSLGILVSAGFIPFTNAFQLMGKPALQSRFLMGLSTLNLAANILLVPRFAAFGSAIGTALSQVAFVPLLLFGIAINLKRRDEY